MRASLSIAKYSEACFQEFPSRVYDLKPLSRATRGTLRGGGHHVVQCRLSLKECPLHPWFRTFAADLEYVAFDPNRTFGRDRFSLSESVGSLENAPLGGDGTHDR